MICFHSIKYRNFLSSGNTFIEIPLDKYANTLIIGANGAGKSSLLDALTFVLFGKPFRNINKPTICNSINGENCEVIVEFSINSRKYRVRRGIKPTIFEIFCNDDLVKQTLGGDYQEYLESNILGMRFKTFTQVVILGSASFVPFMQLRAADRRSLIEDLLDIKIFSVMNIVGKQILKDNEEILKKLQYQISMLNDNLTFIRKTIQDYNNLNQEKKIEVLASLSNYKFNLIQIDTDIKIVEEDIVNLSGSITDKNKQSDCLVSLRELYSKLNSNLQKHTKEYNFFENHDSCPTCQQEINEVLKEEKIQKGQDNIDTISQGLDKLASKINSSIERLKVIDIISEDINKMKRDLASASAEKRSIEKYISRAQKELESIDNKDPLSLDIDKKEKDTQIELLAVEDEKQVLLQDQQYLDVVLSILKDGGIKTKIIKNYIPIINKLVNNFLQKLRHYIQFKFNEEFEESILSRYRDGFSYENFSEGEKLRIDISLLFTFREIAKLKNTVNTNLLIMDEIFDSSLDDSGIEDFLKIMEETDEHTNIFIVSHKQDQMLEKFQNVIKFEKVKLFSTIVVNE